MLSAGLSLAGCASATTPHAGPVVTGVSSAAVSVLQPKLVLKNGEMELVGSVYKTYGGPNTGGTHLDIVFLDRDGRTVTSKLVQFEPGVLRSAVRPPAGRGHYASRLGELPSNIVRVEVRAHDAQTHGS